MSNAKKKIAVLLSGSGVYDGSEIHEAVFTLLAIHEAGAEYVCFAPNRSQHHVVNHITGDEMHESRNCMVEAARIARGEITDLAQFDAAHVDALLIPGGFGAAKNLTDWAFNGPDGQIFADVKSAIWQMIAAEKPIGALCMGPTVIAKALENSDKKPLLTVGSTAAQSPYDIAAISQGMQKLGTNAQYKLVSEIAVDPNLKLVSGPCYMMDANISEVRSNIKQVVDAVMQLMV